MGPPSASRSPHNQPAVNAPLIGWASPLFTHHYLVASRKQRGVGLSVRLRGTFALRGLNATPLLSNICSTAVDS